MNGTFPQHDSWEMYIADIDYGQGNIFDFVYGSTPGREFHHERDVSLLKNRVLETSDENSWSQTTPYSCPVSSIANTEATEPSDTAQKRQSSVPSDPHKVESFRGIVIPASEDDRGQDLALDVTLYRLAAEIVRPSTGDVYITDTRRLESRDLSMAHKEFQS